MKKRYPNKKNILLVNITRLGDMLQSTPTVAGLKMENPDAKITVLVEKQFEEVCHFLPDIDEIVTMDLTYMLREVAREGDGVISAYDYINSLVEDLNSRNFDYCLNMSSSSYTAILLKMLNVDRVGGWTTDDEGNRMIESDWAKLFASSVFHQNRQYSGLNLVDVFRSSADVQEHPLQLKMKIMPEALEYAKKMLNEVAWTASGPTIALQAGASQGKRQWRPERFVKLVTLLRARLDARVLLIGTNKELSIIDPIKAAFAEDPNVFVAAGKTSIPQLGALISLAQCMVTGDTGPMHIAAAVGVPIISMFLASAFGFETGPYGKDHIILQPVIGCGPCNPNKPCGGLECHDTIDPNVVTELVIQRLKGPIESVTESLAPSSQVIVYRTGFDEFGYYSLTALNSEQYSPVAPYRHAYRKLWIDDLAGFPSTQNESPKKPRSTLNVLPDSAGTVNLLEGLPQMIDLAAEGVLLIDRLTDAIDNAQHEPRMLGIINQAITDLDHKIEQIGFHYTYLGPLGRMFVFSKENLSGTDPHSLASQMKDIYEALKRRGEKFSAYFVG